MALTDNSPRTKKHKATSSDVARLAMVSQSTVSRAFTKASSLSPETRQRVLDAAHQLGYSPNAIARSMVSGRTNIIGIIIMRNESPFYSYLLNPMISACREHGYSTMMIRQMENESGADTVTRALEYRVDGVVVTAIEDSESACEICRKSSVPIVLLNRYIAGSGVDSVCCNNYESGKQVAEYLVKRGHHSISCIMGEPSASTTRERLRGIMSCIGEDGITINHIVHGDYTYESGCRMCRQLMESGDALPDALFCSADIIAFGVMDTLRKEYGIRIPEDVSIVGFDDIPEASWASYFLTTMRQPYEELVDTVCRLLTQRIDNPRREISAEQLLCRLIERGTVQDRC